MTAAPGEFDGDLGLNLVFESAPKPPTPDVSALSKKRKNKYDRRREKGRLAKLARMGPSSRDSVVAPGDVSISKPSVVSNDLGVSKTAPVVNGGMLAVDSSGQPDVPPQTSQSNLRADSFSTVNSKNNSAGSQAASSSTEKQANVHVKNQVVQIQSTLQMPSSRRNRVSFSR